MAVRGARRVSRSAGRMQLGAAARPGRVAARAVPSSTRPGASCTGVFSGMRTGTLELTEAWSGETVRLRHRWSPRLRVEVRSPRAYVRRWPAVAASAWARRYAEGLWETDDVVGAVPAGRPRDPARATRVRRRAGTRWRPLAGSAQPAGPEHPRRGASQHRCPLRPGQRPVRAVPGQGHDDVLLGCLRGTGHEPRGCPVGAARARLPAAGAGRRRPSAGDRHRLGRDGDPRRLALRLPRHDHDDLARAARVRAGPGAGARARGPRDGARLSDYRDLAGTVRQARLAGDDRGGRLAVLRRLLPAAAPSCSSRTGSMFLQAIVIEDGAYEAEKRARAASPTS